MRISTLVPVSAAAFLLFAAQSMVVAAGPEPRLVWSGAEVSALGAPTGDGRRLTIVDRSTGDLALRGLVDDDRLRITDSASTDEFAYFSVPSRDGGRVAYAWLNADGFYELRVADVASPGTFRTVYRNSEAGFVQPCAFSPDGEQILTLLFRRDNVSQIALISAEDGTTRTLKSLQWIYPKRMDLSPDGKYVVYDNLSDRHADERDVYVLAIDGSRETRLVSGPTNDLFPLWSPAGDAVLYSSDGAGEPGLWSVPVVDGEAAGEPKLVRPEMGRFLPLGVSDAGDLVYALRTGGSRLAEMRLDGTDRRPMFSDSVEADRFAPSYAPDGSAVAYLARVSSENYGEAHRAVVVRSLPDGKEGEAPDRMAHVERLAWGPGGKGLVLQGSDRRGRAGLFFFDLESGRTEALAIDESADFRGTPGVLLKDRAALIARGKELIRVGPEASDEEPSASFEARLDLLTLSPDGERLALAQVGATRSVWIATSSGKNARKILDLPSGEVTGLSWSGNDEVLVGTRGSNGSRLYLAAAAGDRLQPVPSPKDRLPGVSAYGGQVAFAHGGEREEIWILEHAATPR